MSINEQAVTDCTLALEICNLSKKYGTNKALDNISFTVKKGEIMGFLGPNGAGKSTTMNIITGYLAASDGTVRIDGIDTLENPLETRRKIGYLPEIPPLYTDMTVEEYLGFAYDLKQADPKAKADNLAEIMETVKIFDVKHRLINNLSKGYRQRVGLAQALIGNPDVLILDEPTVGLDPKQIMELRGVIRELGRERTVILSTHIMQEVSAICDSYIIINHGKIAASGQITGEGTGTATDTYRLRTNARLDEIQKALEEADCPIISLEPISPSLEDIFMQVVASDSTTEATENKEAKTE